MTQVVPTLPTDVFMYIMQLRHEAMSRVVSHKGARSWSWRCFDQCHSGTGFLLLTSERLPETAEARKWWPECLNKRYWLNRALVRSLKKK